MRVPALESTVERRLLVNYRVDPEVVARIVPAPFRPQLVDGWAVAGICLIRLGQTRPRGLPRPLGVRSENAAHRIAVEWDTDDGDAVGVYIPRRDTGSALNRAVGGRIFPGEHQKARFRVSESDREVRVAFDSADGAVAVDVAVAVSERFDSQVFEDLAAASRFFEQGACGYSATRDAGRFDGLELRTEAWRVEPTELRFVRSSFFDDTERFPAGSALLDCALVMRDVPVTWHARASLRGDQQPVLMPDARR